MPNTPALVSEGATGLFANRHTSDEQAALAESILSAVGICSWLESEDQIDMVKALSGRGPAYYFLLMEAMEQAAIAMGLPAEMARRFTVQTALGAAKLAASSDVAPDELRRRVTSPGGTTEAAIKSFESEAFRSIVNRAIVAAQKRSIELAN
jgi:pyrroline-5-carboxylate reductase